MRPPENSSELTAEQCEALQARVFPMLSFLRKLVNRIDQLGFPADDRFRREVQNAYDAIHDLRMALHYMECNRRKRPVDGTASSLTDNYAGYRAKRKG